MGRGVLSCFIYYKKTHRDFLFLGAQGIVTLGYNLRWFVCKVCKATICPFKVHKIVTFRNELALLGKVQKELNILKQKNVFTWVEAGNFTDSLNWSKMYLKLRLKSAVCKHDQIDQAASVGNFPFTLADIKLTFGAEQLFVTGWKGCLSEFTKARLCKYNNHLRVNYDSG